MKITEIRNAIYGFLKDVIIGGIVLLFFATLCFIAYLIVTYVSEEVILASIFIIFAVVIGHEIRIRL